MKAQRVISYLATWFFMGASLVSVAAARADEPGTPRAAEQTTAAPTDRMAKRQQERAELRKEVQALRKELRADKADPGRVRRRSR